MRGRGPRGRRGARRAARLLAAAPAAGAAAASAAVHVYNWADYIGKDTIAQFEKRTGIKVVYDTYDADETLEAKMMAGDSGYDVVSTSTDYLRPPDQGRNLPAARQALLPNWNNLDPHVLALEATADPGNRYAMPYLRHVNGFAYNVDMIRARMPMPPSTAST